MQKGLKRKLVVSIMCGLAIATTACDTETVNSIDTAPEVTPEETDTAGQSASNLEVLEEDFFPISAQYPAELEANVMGSGEGSVAVFAPAAVTEAAENTALSIFLPRGTAEQSVEDYLTSFINDPNGLIASNGWQVIEPETASFTAVDYTWVDTVIDFETDSGDIGHILVGKAYGQTVQTTLQYPSEEADLYLPMMKTVLDSVTFDESQLPLADSGV